MSTKYVYDVTVSVPQPAAHFADLRKNYIGALSSATHTDLRLSAQDGSVVWVHQCVLLPLCPWLADMIKDVACCDYPKVILDCVNEVTLATVVELLYTGRCHLTQEVSDAKVLEALARLGMHLSRDSTQVVESFESAVLDLSRRTCMALEPTGRRQQDVENNEQEEKFPGEVEFPWDHLNLNAITGSRLHQCFEKVPRVSIYQSSPPSWPLGESSSLVPSTKEKDHVTKKQGSVEKPNGCNICTKTFSQAGDLERHKMVHSGEKPHICNICDKTFSLSWNLKAHVLAHSRGKPHICKICTKSFALAGTLKDHKLTHSGKKPHSCNMCTKSFCRASKLERHKLVHNHTA